MKKREASTTVYSTESGRHCRDCGAPQTSCRCKKKQAAVPGDGIVRVSRQTKGRKGKGVSLVTGLPLADQELQVLGRELKQRCGSGGTVKEGIVEIQGDHRALLVTLLQEKGYKVKLAGG